MNINLLILSHTRKISLNLLVYEQFLKIVNDLMIKLTLVLSEWFHVCLGFGNLEEGSALHWFSRMSFWAY